MFVEQNKENLQKTYNLFSQGKSLEVPKSRLATRRKEKKEIKLVFHHPNLLFLNPKKVKSSQESIKEAGENLIRNIQYRGNHADRSTTLFRPSTSYQSNDPYKASAPNTPQVRRRHTEEMLEVCGKSSCVTMTNGLLSKSHFRTKKTSYNSTLQAVKRANRGVRGSDAEKHASRLKMYLSVEKQFLKYVMKNE